MRLSQSHRAARLGSARIFSLQRVIELESDPSFSADTDTISISQVDLQTVSSQLAIVVPCKNEPVPTIQGVLSGIPQSCLIILVSNSQRQPADLYAQEVQSLAHFCSQTRRSAIALHQRDAGAAAAVKAAGMPQLVDESCGLVYHGKGEGMLLGLALAALSGRKHIGFVDADNYVPGSVLEYCRVFAAGLLQADMVRVCWPSKPKCNGDGKLDFERRGRCSQVVNGWLNRLLEGSGSGWNGGEDGDCLVKTGNAGEHAMTVELGVRMKFASGYAVEPGQLTDLFDGGGGGGEKKVLQVETRNPHFHQDRGEDHVKKMWAQGLNAIYWCEATPPDVKEDILRFMVGQGVLDPGQAPPRGRVYPPASQMDFLALYEVLMSQASSFRVFDGKKLAGRTPSPPIRRFGSGSPCSFSRRNTL